MNALKQPHTRTPLFNIFIKGEVQLGGWGIVGSLLAMLNMYLLVSALDLFHYGLYVLVIALLSLVTDLALGLMQTVVQNDVTRFVGAGDAPRAKRLFLENVAFQIIMGVFSSLAFFFGADLAAAWYGEDIARLVRVVSPLPFISVLYTSMRMFLQANLRFNVLAFRSIVFNGLRTIFLLFFILFLSLNVHTALIAYVGASFAALLVFIPPFVRAYAPWKAIVPVREWVLWNIARTYGKWALFGASIKDGVLDIRPWLIKLFVDTEAVALYAVAETIYGTLKKFYPKNTLRTLISHIIHERERSIEITLRSVKYLFLFGIVLAVAGALGVPALILLLFTHYQESIPLFYILLVTLPFLGFRIPLRAFLVALRRQRFLFVFQILTIVSSLVSPFILLPLFGVLGMALERVVSMVLVIVITLWYVSRYDIPRSAWGVMFRFDKEDRRFLKRVRVVLRQWARNAVSRIYFQ